MGKKIIIVIGIMLLSIMMFGCAAKGNLKVPSTLELKDEYKKDVNTEFDNKLKLIVTKYTELYNQKEPLIITDLDSLLKLDLKNNNSPSPLTEIEKLLLSKSSKVNGDLIIECDKPTSENKIKLKNDIQILLNYYK